LPAKAKAFKNGSGFASIEQSNCVASGGEPQQEVYV
jgi:hypothetical protein